MADNVVCEECFGSGELYQYSYRSKAVEPVDCPYCNGTGKTEGSEDGKEN